MVSGLVKRLREGAAWTWFFFSVCLGLLLVPFAWKRPSLASVIGRLEGIGGLFLLGLRYRIEGEENLYSHTPCIYVINHQTNWDIVLMGQTYPWNTVAIAKKELRLIPVFGWFFAGVGMVLIDRKNKKHSIAGLEEAVNALKERGSSIWIFPEGTRNKSDDLLLPFKKGAFHMALAAGVPIVIILNRAVDQIWKQREVFVRVLPPVLPSQYQGLSPDELLEKIRALMIAEMTTNPKLGFVVGKL